MIFIGSKAAVALFVEDLLQTLELDFRSITVMRQGKSEDCCVLIAIDTWLEGTVEEVALTFSLQRITTS